MKKKSINSAKKLAFGMWCGVRLVALCCKLFIYVMNSVPNFFLIGCHVSTYTCTEKYLSLDGEY